MNNGPWKVAPLCCNGLLALLLLAAVFAAYQPVWHIGYIRGELVDTDLRSWQGLRHIWTQQGQLTTEDQHLGRGKAYYPLAFTTYWLEYHLWGFHPLGYYLDNVLLHGLDAVVLWLILRRLSVPGAWLGGALWALHPVNVESVAWIEERKNILSGFFYLCSLWAALKYWLPELRMPRECPANVEENHQSLATPVPVADRHGPIQFFWVALALYVLSLLSKAATIPLPAVILLLVWWKRGRVLWRDVQSLLIFLVVGIGMALDTMHVEHNLSKWTGNFGTVFALPLVDRFLIAGRDIWFYLGKLLWPHPLIFNYPRWKIDPLSATAWLQLLVVPALLWLFWLKRHSWGRPALFVSLYFLVLLAPTLGLVNAMFFRRSFVADHYQYLACIGPLALAAALMVTLIDRLGKAGRVLKPLLGAGLLFTLGILTWNQCHIYADPETLCKTTLALNPDAWLIRNDLADLLFEKGQLDAAADQLRMALQTHPDAKTSCRLADTLLDSGKPDEAMVYFNKALQIQPDFAMAYEGLGHACMAMGRMDEAIDNFQKELQIQPNIPLPYYDLGCAYAQSGKLDLAVDCFQKAVNLQDDFAPAHNNLANVLEMEGRTAEAEEQWRAALKSEPDLVSVQVNLAWILATSPQDSLRDGAEAVELAERANQLTGGKNPAVLRALAAAYAENGQFSYAVAATQRALQIVSLQGHAQSARYLQQQLKFYQNNQPFRDTTITK